MALAKLEDAKRLLGLTDEVEDGALQLCLDAAEGAIKAYCKRDFASQEYTEYYTGHNTQFLVLRQSPVTAVANVWVDAGGWHGQGASAFASSTLLTAGTDYSLEYQAGTTSKSGILLRIGNVWPSLSTFQTPRAVSLLDAPATVFGNVKVQYTAGFTAANVPDEVKFSILSIASVAYNRRTSGGLPYSSESYEGYSYQLGAVATQALTSAVELGSVRQMLQVWRRVVL